LQESYPVKRLCSVFNVYRSSYRYWIINSDKKSPESVQEEVMVKAIFNESGGSAGARTIADITLARGNKISRYRASKIMRELNLKSSQIP